MILKKEKANKGCSKEPWRIKETFEVKTNNYKSFLEKEISKFTQKSLEKNVSQVAVEAASLKHKCPIGLLKLSEGARNYLSMSTMV